jgi:PRTRC genetic system protein A
LKPTRADLALMSNTPVEMVPMQGEFVPLARFGHRFLAAKDGLWLEAKRPWGRVMWPLAHQDPLVRMPFGTLQAEVQIAFQYPSGFIERFVRDALLAYPAEVGAVVIWNSRNRSVRYHLCESVAAGVGHLRERWPDLSDDESVCMDIHSHGPIPAYFSAIDREDTGSDMVLALVVGKLDQNRPEIALSLFACGLELPMMGAPTATEFTGWGEICQR